jgi:two-component system sensor histidine kinase RegB
MDPPEPRAINCDWLLRLRLGSLLGQLGTIGTVQWGMGIQLPLVPLFALIALALGTTLGALYWRRKQRAIPDLLLHALMVHDVLHLTALLSLTGGPLNPFGFLYLVLIAMAAVSMTSRFTWALATLSAVCSALLFVWNRPLPMSHAEQMQLHIPGMWVAFSVAAIFIVYFLMRVTHALREREHELQAARNLALRKEKLASLATLAAGAAHELGTPLSTINLVAKELLRNLTPTAEGLREDLELICESVDRCRSVLTQLARDAGQHPGENLSTYSVSDWVTSARQPLPSFPPVFVHAVGQGAAALLTGPERALTHALSALLKNAQDASLDAGHAVDVYVQAVGSAIEIQVADTGTGMDPATLTHAGEPFFTTKQPGRGMGLGLFLCREVATSMGGSLHIESSKGKGTTATLRIPISSHTEASP